jgi:hypothetical protein
VAAERFAGRHFEEPVSVEESRTSLDLLHQLSDLLDECFATGDSSARLEGLNQAVSIFAGQAVAG